MPSMWFNPCEILRVTVEIGMGNKTKGNLFVVGQFALLAVIAFVPSRKIWIPNGLFEVIAVILQVFGVGILIVSATTLGRNLTANPVPLENARLKTNGIYGLVRHPIYFGLISTATGLVVNDGPVVSLVALLALIALLDVKARFEEKLLLEKFEEYAHYAAKVGRLFPGIGRIRQS
jgi:protein-S-isoprenylcysteine O-methyltransferase Ste14